MTTKNTKDKKSVYEIYIPQDIQNRMEEQFNTEEPSQEEYKKITQRG
jgi:hypothetical protein